MNTDIIGNALWKTNDPIDPTILSLNTQHQYLISSINHGKAAQKASERITKRITISDFVRKNKKKGTKTRSARENKKRWQNCSRNQFNARRKYIALQLQQQQR